MNQESEITKKLSFRKVILPIILGLGVASYILYDSLTSVRFEKAESGKGAYEWIDENQNQVPDLDNKLEFSPAEHGDYNIITYKDTFSRIDWTWVSTFWLLMALVCLVARIVGYMARLRILTDKSFSWRQCFDVIVLWEFASALTPSVVGGSGVAIYFINREGINFGRSTAIVMITALLDELFYILMVPIVLLFIHRTLLFPENWQKTILGFTLNAEGFFWAGYLFICILTIGIVIAIFISPRTFKYIIIKIFSFPFLRRWRYSMIKWGDDLMVSSRYFKTKSFSFWLKTFGATYISWSARFLLVNCLILMLVHVNDHMLIYGKQLAMWIIMLISPTPGSSGLAEFAFSEFLGGSVIPVALVGLLVILWRLLTYFFYIFLGIFILPRWLRKTRSKVAQSIN